MFYKFSEIILAVLSVTKLKLLVSMRVSRLISLKSKSEKSSKVDSSII